MGRSGPVPLPTVIKRMRGTLRADRTNPAEPKPLPVSSLAAPSWLSTEGRKVFRSLARQLAGMKVIGDADIPVLALLADQWAIYFGARKFLEEQQSEVFTLRDADGNVRGIQQFPQVAIRNKAALMIAKLSAEFGLTPSARSRVNVAPAEPETEDPLEGFLVAGGRRG